MRSSWLGPDSRPRPAGSRICFSFGGALCFRSAARFGQQMPCQPSQRPARPASACLPFVKSLRCNGSTTCCSMATSGGNFNRSNRRLRHRRHRHQPEHTRRLLLWIYRMFPRLQRGGVLHLQAGVGCSRPAAFLFSVWEQPSDDLLSDYKIAL